MVRQRVYVVDCGNSVVDALPLSLGQSVVRVLGIGRRLPIRVFLSNMSSSKITSGERGVTVGAIE